MKSDTRSTIICVDDEKMLLNILYEQLFEWFGTNYTVEKALGGEEALAILDDCIQSGTDVSVVISDYVMPNMKGDELLSNVRARDPRIRKIMLTGYSSIDGIVSAINKAGLYRYITKPWDNKDLMLTVVEAIKSYEQEKKASDLSNGFESLYRQYEKLYLGLQNNYDQTIRALASAIDARDPITAGHSERVAHWSALIGRACDMNESSIKYLEYAAIIHDLGKIGMNDNLLKGQHGLMLYNQPDYVKQQNAISESIIKNMNQPEKIIDGIKYHWEKYDGTGVYGLKGDNIPLDARIIGLANYYDLMIGNIAKGQSIPPEASAKIISKGEGTLFDPKLTNIFMRLLLQ